MAHTHRPEWSLNPRIKPSLFSELRMDACDGWSKGKRAGEIRVEGERGRRPGCVNELSPMGNLDH
jgi:hypothetical protein